VDVRPAVATDADAVFRLRTDLTEWLCGRGVEQWEPDDIALGSVQDAIAAGHVHVVERDGVLLASVTVTWEDPLVWDEPGGTDDGVGYIHMLMVGRAWAGRGIGRDLLAWAEGHIAGRPRPLARLDCVRSNDRLRAYYEHAGYRLVGFKDFPAITWARETALYEKRLSGRPRWSAAPA